MLAALSPWLEGDRDRGEPRKSTSAIVTFVLRLTSLHRNGRQMVAVSLL